MTPFCKHFNGTTPPRLFSPFGLLLGGCGRLVRLFFDVLRLLPDAHILQLEVNMQITQIELSCLLVPRQTELRRLHWIEVPTRIDRR